MKKRKRDDSYLPANARTMKTLRFLEDWHIVRMPQTGPGGVTHELEYIVSADEKVYRRAFTHEQPDLYIDLNILPPEHGIRLVRITNKPLRIAVKKRLRRQRRVQGGG